jgi:hypothetical protein
MTGSEIDDGGSIPGRGRGVVTPQFRSAHQSNPYRSVAAWRKFHALTVKSILLYKSIYSSQGKNGREWREFN